MSDGEERDTSGAGSGYGEELLRANWNPVVELLQWSCERTRAMTGRDERRRACTDEEAAAFLGRIYRAGT